MHGPGRPDEWQRAAGGGRAERGALTTEVVVRDFWWERQGRRILNVPRLELDGPGIVILVGASGAGKSTLLKALSGTLADYQGGHSRGTVEHRLHGEPRAIRIGYVPQDPLDGFLAFDPETEVQLRLQAAGWSRPDAVAESRRALAGLDLEGKERVALSHLSGGERKRLALRAALLHAPHLLLLDEPLNHLDDEWRPKLLEDLLAAAETGLVVAAVHDVDHWLGLAKSVVVVEHGEIAWTGPPDQFTTNRERFPQTRRPSDGFLPPPRHGGPELLVAHGLSAMRGRPLFRELDLAFPLGVHAITGTNGSGKSTLLRLLAGLERPQEGAVRFDHWDLADLSARERAAFIAFHFEEPGRAFFLPSCAQELAFQPHNAGRTAFEAETATMGAAQLLRLDGMLERHPLTLSGGEQERLAIGCLETAQPRLILLDEPTHGLDAAGWSDVLAFLERHRRSACIILATHEPDLVRRADTVHRFDGERLLQIRLGSASPYVEVVPRRPS